MKIMIQAAAVTFLAASAAHAQQAVQWRVEDGGNGHWYGWGRVQISDASFFQTRDAAVALGGHLPTVTSSAENQFVFNTIGGGLGLFRQPGGVWTHVTEEPVTFVNWASGQPDSPATFTFAAFCCHPSNTWADFTDAELGNPADPYTDFRVEYDADCNSDGIVDYGQILDGTLPDSNSNGIPDCCEGSGSCCVGDILADRVINGADLGALLAYWGPVTTSPISLACDLIGDNVVSGADIGLMLAGWGNCP